MNDKNEILTQNLPGDIAPKIQEMFDLIPTSGKQVCVVSHQANEAEARALFSEITRSAKLREYRFEYSFIGNDEDISRNAPINRAARTVLVMDSRNLWRGADIALTDYIAAHDALKAGLSIVLLHIEWLPSSTEVISTVQKVLDIKGLKSSIHAAGKEDTGEWLAREFQANPVNLQDVADEKTRDIAIFVRDTLENQLADTEQQLATLETTIARFKEHQESFEIHSKQLDLTLWVKIQDYCDTHFDDDITLFAREARSQIDKELHTIDVQKIQYYFSPYLNYLWGAFLTNEIKYAMDAVQDDMEYELASLTAKYKKFFGKDIESFKLAANDVRAGNQPISFDSVDIYNYSVKNVVEGIIRNVITFVACFHGGFWGYAIGKVVTNALMKLFGNLLRIKRGDTELIQLYSEAATEQFDNGLEHIKTQLKETLLPSLEKNFKSSIGDIKEGFTKNIAAIEEQYNQKKKVLSTRYNELKNQLNEIA
jgi:hypothetical protein